jgi:hypothetical protein
VKALIDIVAIWLPIILLLIGVAYFGRRQMRDYRGHVESVNSINAEIADVTRKTHEIAVEQLAVLKQIKSLLEDRKT